MGSFPYLDLALYPWLCKTLAVGVPVSVALLQEKAKAIAGKVVEEYKDCSADTCSRLKIDDIEKFTASNGWWHNFRRGCGLRTGVAAG